MPPPPLDPITAVVTPLGVRAVASIVGEMSGALRSKFGASAREKALGRVADAMLAAGEDAMRTGQADVDRHIRGIFERFINRPETGQAFARVISAGELPDMPALADVMRAVGAPVWAEHPDFEVVVGEMVGAFVTAAAQEPALQGELGLERLGQLVAEARVGNAVGRELLRLLTEIRDRLPGAPAPAVEVDPGPRVELRLPSGGRFFEGRGDELAALDKAWADPGIRVQTVIGIGGEGKTALAKRWLAGMAGDDYRGAARVYGWSFYSQGASEHRQVAADLFFEELLRWLGDPEPSAGDPWAKGARAAEMIRAQPTLLVLDGLEPLQFPPGQERGRVKDPGLAALLRALAARMTGLCLVTSRDAVRDLDGGLPGVAVMALPPLSGPVGATVLRGWGVAGDEAELRAAVADVKGHALAVNLMGSYLAMYEAGDARRRGRIEGLLEAEDDGEHARRVMLAYDRWLAPDDRRVLRIMGLFDRSADEATVGAVLKAPVIEGLTEGLEDGVEGRRWLKAVKHLRDVGLLLDEGGLDAHPLVREAFGEMLRGEAPAAWAAAHGRVFEHLRGAAAYQPDDLAGLEPLYQAVMHGCVAGRQQEAFSEVYERRIKRGSEHYTARKLGAFAADLAAVAYLFERPWSRPYSGLPAHTRSWLLNDAGFALRALGRLAEAVGPMGAALELGVEQQSWQSAAIRAGNLSELLLTLGRLDPTGGADGALARARQAVAHADRSGDALWRMSQRAALADALAQRGRRTAAYALFADAERLQAKRQPELPRLYSLAGYRYGDLLLSDRPAAARARAAWMLRAVRLSDTLGPALHHLLLGRAALVVGPADQAFARRHLDAAVAGLRRAGQQDYLPRGLLARAAFHRTTGDLDPAAADLAETRGIAERGQMRLHLADVELETARLELARGDLPAAEQAYTNARDLVLAIRYHRRDGELDELARALVQTPPDWLHQADETVDIPVRRVRRRKRPRLKNPKRSN